MKRLLLLVVLGFAGYIILFYFQADELLDPSVTIEKIIVIKGKRRLLLISNDSVVKNYRVSLGRVPKGHKEHEGDNKTPEGFYYISGKNPQSAYHKNLGISYPNPKDIENAKVIGKNPGGLIKIHGLKKGYSWIGKFHLFIDWTHGCIALTNKEVAELYRRIEIGTPIEIQP